MRAHSPCHRATQLAAAAGTAGARRQPAVPLAQAQARHHPQHRAWRGTQRRTRPCGWPAACPWGRSGRSQSGSGHGWPHHRRLPRWWKARALKLWSGQRTGPQVRLRRAHSPCRRSSTPGTGACATAAPQARRRRTGQRRGASWLSELRSRGDTRALKRGLDSPSSNGAEFYLARSRNGFNRDPE